MDVVDQHQPLTVQRYSLKGRLQKNLATVKGLGLLAGETGIPPVPYNSKGTELAAGTVNGLELISNAGGVIRKLPVPKVAGGLHRRPLVEHGDGPG